MAEAIHEQIVVALRDWLTGIVADGGATAWYTPDRVIRAAAFYDGCLDPTRTTIYTLVPVRVEARPLTSSMGILANLIVDLAVATRFTPSTEDPFGEQPPIRWTVQTRLEQDAKRRLFGNYRLLGADGAHLFTSVPVTDYASDLTYLEGWAVVYLRVVLRYLHKDTTP